MVVTKSGMDKATRYFVWPLPISIQKNMVAAPKAAMPDESASHTITTGRRYHLKEGSAC